MTRILLIAPGASPPWTEGRKNLVRDLLAELRRRGFWVDLISGSNIECSNTQSSIQMFLKCIAQFFRAPVHTYDTVIVFPYGRFSGVLGTVNKFLIRLTKMWCSWVQVRCWIFLYSADGVDLSVFSQKNPKLAAIGVQEKGVLGVPLGIRPLPIKWDAHARARPKVLFMSGYQSPSKQAFNGILQERGLADLLAACGQLTATKFELKIAIPLLRHAEMKRLLQAAIDQACPALQVTLLDDIDPIQELLSCDAFVFPYRRPHAVFTPHSLLEAMHLGVPTIAADHDMYATLTRPDGVAGIGLFPAGDVEALTGCLKETLAAPKTAIALAKGTSGRVRENWTIQRCADAVLEGMGIAIKDSI